MEARRLRWRRRAYRGIEGSEAPGGSRRYPGHTAGRGVLVRGRRGPSCASGPAHLCSFVVTKIPLRRFTARALPIDDHDRVLLLYGFDPVRPDQPFWFTIGGAAEGGETLQEAAARELFEEVGMRADPQEFTGPYASSVIEFEWSDYAITQDQTFFAIRVGPGAAVSFEHMEQIEKDTTTAYRWWSVAELESTREVFFPENLAEILRKITADGGPA
ncbi:NUDIX domain-containing protein [Nonomuraea longispora]|uniref:NUDIX domain-containing protein n=1 Tax=Nonomuraea longispora TaxID=1848320 RepID=A0A4R4N813_9ACTN|nr:NUDIX domain-containing protein [Nonomuraea longispora]